MGGARPARDQTPADEATSPELIGRTDIGLLRQLWRFRAYGRRELRPLVAGVVARFFELLADLAAPWPLALVIDNVVKGQVPSGFLGDLATLFGPSPVGMLAVAALAVLVITGVSGVFDYLGDRLMNSAGERITSGIRTEVFAHMQRLPMGFHDRQAVGELTSRVSTDTSRIEDGMVGLFSTLIPGVLALIGYSAVLLSVNWRLGLIALAVAPLLFLTASRYTRLIRRSARRTRAAEGRMSGFVAESLQGIRTVHAFGRQDLHDQRFGADNDKVLRTGLRNVELRARFTPLMQFVAALGTAALLFVGGFGAVSGWWTVGVLVVASAYLREMLKPMRSLAKLALTFTQGAVAAERIAAVLDQERPSADTQQPLPARVTGEIQLRDVTLDYGRGPVLDRLNLVVNPGERIALLGQNGVGKSTVLALISGLYAPTRGTVLLDGLPISEVPDRWRHQQVAVVLQDTFLFSGTIAENIRYGRPDASDAAVNRAADAALVTEFTSGLASGLRTELADGGVGLSGGQRQRVGIARALLTDAPVVLLDEPTTGLDGEAEELVIRALSRLMHGRTVLMTTHRPALIRISTRTVTLTRSGFSQSPERNGSGPAHHTPSPWCPDGRRHAGAGMWPTGPIRPDRRIGTLPWFNGTHDRDGRGARNGSTRSHLKNQHIREQRIRDHDSDPVPISSSVSANGDGSR